MSTFTASYQLRLIGPQDLWGLFTTHSGLRVRIGTHQEMKDFAERLSLSIEPTQ